MRKLKVKFDNKTGELVLRVHVHDFSDLRTQAELRIYDRLKETLDDETRAFYERLGAIPMTGGPAQMHEFQKNEIALWKRIVVKAKVPLQ